MRVGVDPGSGGRRFSSLHRPENYPPSPPLYSLKKKLNVKIIIIKIFLNLDPIHRRPSSPGLEMGR